MVVQVGDKFPENIVFRWVPYSDELAEVTEVGVAESFNASEDWKNKKVALFAVPGAFTTGCSRTHLPGIIKHLDQLKKQGVDVVAVVASNDPFVQSAWGRANKVQHNDLIFISDEDVKLAEAFDLVGPSGKRYKRFAILIDNGVVKYVGVDEQGVKNSSAEALLAALNKEQAKL